MATYLTLLHQALYVGILLYRHVHCMVVPYFVPRNNLFKMFDNLEFLQMCPDIQYYSFDDLAQSETSRCQLQKLKYVKKILLFYLNLLLVNQIQNFFSIKVWWHAATLFIYFYINRADIQYFINTTRRAPLLLKLERYLDESVKI